MFKLVVNVSAKIAKIVPPTHKLEVAERDFGDLNAKTASAGEESLQKSVQSMLKANGVTDSDLYSISYPDALRDEKVPEPTSDETKEQTKQKGPVTKPENPKEGETTEK